MSRSAVSAYAFAVAALAAGCGNGAKRRDAAYNCLLRLQATARADTIISLYGRGELGTKAQFERRRHTRIPFLDRGGHIIPYEKMAERRALRMDTFGNEVTGTSSKVLVQIIFAIDRAKEAARTQC